MLLRGMGPENAEFVRLSCVGIARVTQKVIFSQMMARKLPRVRSSLVLRRNVGGFEHKGTGVAMKVRTDYVFDGWPTPNFLMKRLEMSCWIEPAIEYRDAERGRSATPP